MTPASLRPIGFIPTRNAEAARAFYEGTLGLTFVSDDQFALVFRLAGDIMLRVVRVGEFQPAQFTIFGWETRDIESSVDELAAKGVEFLRFDFMEQDARGIWNSPSGAKVAWFKDPDGNVLSFSQH
ncbi:MAG TPA: VOC family protein [Acidobacteriaceae bacterium]|jgi:catechol 2,3-dioxygenase-like lactoylglutathione lyase family enzyme